MLSVESVSVDFGGVQALRDVSLTVPSGQITGLIGPNGAGKTTLFNVITGLQRPSSGRILLGSRVVTHLGPERRARAGMARTFQRLEVFGSLTVRENVAVAVEQHGGWRRRGGRATADALLAQVGLSALADDQAGVLPTGSARLLELARALATEPTVLLLDEPVSGLDEAESRKVGELLLHVAAEGTAVLIVEHDVELVMRLCQRLYVLDFGVLLAEGSPAQVQSDSAVQEAYLGVGAATS